MKITHCSLAILALSCGIDSLESAEVTATSSVTVGDSSSTSASPSPEVFWKGYNWLSGLPTAPGAVFKYIENPTNSTISGNSTIPGLPANSAVLSQILNRPLGKWWWSVATSGSTAATPASRLQMALDEKNTLNLFDPVSTTRERAFSLVSAPSPQFALIGRNAAPLLGVAAGVPGSSFTYAETSTGTAVGAWLMNRSAGAWEWRMATGLASPFDRLQLKLGSNNSLTLFAKDGTTPSIVLTPANGATAATAIIGGAQILTTSSSTLSPTFSGLSTTTLTTSKVGIGKTIPTLPLDVVGAGAFTGNLAASSFSGSGAALTALNATQLTTGTIPTAQLPSSVSQFGNPTASALQILRRNGANTGYEFATISSPAGPIGATGAAGPVGPVGPEGKTGLQGLPGTNGANGVQGVPGPALIRVEPKGDLSMGEFTHEPAQ
jgi:Collagen triple helix repeat (20 copies)